MLMLLEAWEGINLSRHVAFSKQKMIIETIPTIQGQDSHFRFAKRCWNQTTVQTFSSWLQHHKKTQKRIKFPVPVIHLKSETNSMRIKDYNHFDKPNEQSQAYLNYAMARTNGRRPKGKANGRIKFNNLLRFLGERRGKLSFIWFYHPSRMEPFWA